jgi:hypothetical protein
MMRKTLPFLLLTLIVLNLLLFSCNNDDNNSNLPPIEEEQIEEEEEEVPPVEEEPVPEDPAGAIEVFNSALVYDHYILVNDALANRVYLMDKDATLVHEWSLDGKIIGNDGFLLANGKLLVALEADDPKINFGGQGGRIRILDKAGVIEWNFDYATEDYQTHHDVEILPNGNILAIAWEKKTAELAVIAGSNLGVDVYPETIIEINPETDEIIWQWHAWDHLIQDHDATKENFGVLAQNPQLINLNYVQNTNGNIMHANGISYDKTNDLIYLSVNFFSEVWVIDHSTTTAEAAVHSGGNYNKGGDLVYRFGNPTTYNNTEGTRMFYNNHYPNLLEGSDEGKILVFSNGNGFNQSTVYELQLPADLSLLPETNNEPEVVWSFTDPNLYSDKVSGAVRLPNGNTLITEGDYGIWEVTQIGEVVWKFNAIGFFWRAYSYEKDAPGVLALELDTP